MKLYHGSKNGNLTAIKRMQAEAGEGMEVPKDELLEAIYLTPDYGSALAMGARPYGRTDIDDEKKIIEFEKPELFNPEEPVYVYELNVPDEKVRMIDKWQAVVENEDKLKPTEKHTHKAGDIKEYGYELKNWRRGDQELPSEIKIR